ncbi:aspartate/glutamate racemase family protein [Bacillus horti]|uniref:Aspartate racemase n=1 Tax=Caldalkalibacillus horti TaxID=77523 RepID=A0ABT9VW95_9BACI|nr:aspartate/glutamate racemase family protein [Bacillus horti]MDQ0165265.1 aspartate racemase [Bacillus horti]
MKTIGLLGGMSWESTQEYYRVLNEEVKARLGGLHSAECLLYSVDFAEIEECQRNNDWDRAADILTEAAKKLERAGAEAIVICTNTMHKLVDFIQSNIQVPILHIANATAKQIQKKSLTTIALLGTRYTMEQDFYKERIESQGINILIPDKEDRDTVHRVIYEELCLGVINQDSKAEYKKIIESLRKRGAEGVILGCTEITLLIKDEDVSLPLFDTTRIHAQDAVDFMLNK